MEIKVNYRKINSIFNHSTQTDVVRTEKGSDGSTIIGRMCCSAISVALYYLRGYFSLLMPY
jgi:hypothetical protein